MSCCNAAVSLQACAFRLLECCFLWIEELLHLDLLFFPVAFSGLPRWSYSVISAWLAVLFELFGCSVFAASSWVLVRCIYWSSNSFLCCCYWVSNMCFVSLSRVLCFWQLASAGLCCLCCGLLQVAWKPLGRFGALEIAPLAVPAGSPILEPLIVVLCLVLCFGWWP
ncbi:hypothetical protein U1Q18_014477 [Sarracenia purpurea var. burkii]